MKKIEREIPVNHYARLKDGRMGLIKFYGYLQGKTKRYVGLELLSKEGKHDGFVQGHRYFQCRANQGLMVTPSKLHRIFEARMTEREAREEARLYQLHSQFPAVGTHAERVASTTRALVHMESRLNSIFSYHTLHLIFEFADFFVTVDLSQYSGRYDTKFGQWDVTMILKKDGSYQITGINTVGYVSDYNYKETGSYDVDDGILYFESHNAKGDNVGKLFHGTCHQRGSTVKRTIKLKPLLRFRTEKVPFLSYR